jgi:hypothetical protein
VCPWINKEIPRQQRRYVSAVIMGNKLGVMRKKSPETKRHCDTWERDWRGKNSWVHELKAGFQSCLFGFWRSMET